MIYHSTAQEHHFVCQSVSQVFIILEIYNLGKCMCVSVTCFLSTSFFHFTIAQWLGGVHLISKQMVYGSYYHFFPATKHMFVEK